MRDKKKFGKCQNKKPIPCKDLAPLQFSILIQWGVDRHGTMTLYQQEGGKKRNEVSFNYFILFLFLSRNTGREQQKYINLEPIERTNRCSSSLKYMLHSSAAHWWSSNSLELSGWMIIGIINTTIFFYKHGQWTSYQLVSQTADHLFRRESPEYPGTKSLVNYSQVTTQYNHVSSGCQFRTSKTSKSLEIGLRLIEWFSWKIITVS